ncbi:hypothetical protein TPHA_0G00900 [Tetrapisispora phaffii CBS 4417]|uniref:Peroxisomal membrane protein PEX14 n=1 Tax=Tetrapisispora phaffii (strain ATCC 24235 / CBS 4417 / NBRC 1672 / NRRL Y-8282 / UCD 70-5) TaxID=1071381 RepID=G8BVJ8_TETPH|nr:hypothetical protein TPHA_0G00900 [Tetrapisispora phaffii CBS 4417]CCE63926.1 hypothetical protein TPHA_0G00900 [Tetrapisispora phaffii CBS 4417]
MVESSEVHRDELLQSSVSFLKDPSIINAPLSKKIEFLKSKGLDDKELELVLELAKKKDEPSISSFSANNRQNNRDLSYQNDMYDILPPPLPTRDWRDYFIMTTASAGIIYGVYELTKRYVLPNILPESQTKLEQDKLEIQKQMNKVDKLLANIETDMVEKKQKEEERFNILDNTIQQFQNTLDDSARTRQRLEDDLSNIKSEIDMIKNSVSNFINKFEGEQNMDDILREIESLKQLIRSSNGNKTLAETTGSKYSSPNAPVPGIDEIPSTSELLARMNIKSTLNSNSQIEKASQIENTESQIPSWQKHMVNEVDVSNLESTSFALEQDEDLTMSMPQGQDDQY